MIASGQRTWPTRAVARSARAMVASPHPQATAAGVDVLRRGGNAVDAAIAVNAVLTVVYPASCGIGGDAFWIVHDPRRPATMSYNGSGRTPRAAALDRLPGGVLPERGALSVTVPGAVRSWEDVAAAHGTRGLDELLAPAEALARDRFVVTDVVARYIAMNEPMLRGDAEAARIFLRNGLPRAGDVLYNVDLAETLRAIRRGGADAFYGGETAERILRTLNARGNVMTADDLAAHRTEPTTPLRLEWNGGELLAHPPNSQASCTLLALGMLAGDRDAAEPLWQHLAIEAMKRAIAVRDATFADPASFASGIERELQPDRLARHRAAIDPQRAAVMTSGIDHGDTVGLVVVDENGMAVSLIESLYMNFGSGLVAEGSGVVLHNRGAYFSTSASHPNAYAGGKRPMHTLSPGMFVRGGAPELVYAQMGGDGQPQFQAQLLHNYYDRGLDVQQALDAPRWVYGRRARSTHPEIASAETVLVESRTSDDVIAGLEARGHRLEAIGAYDSAMGHMHAIAIDRERGTLAGGGDPRADSLALGL